MDVVTAIGLLANVGVLGGIVFLAIEVRQNNDVLRSQARSARTQGKQEIVRQLAENELLIEALLKATGGEPLLPAQRYILIAYYEQIFTHWQFSFLEYQANRIELEDLDLSGWRYWFNGGRFPLIQQTWEEVVRRGRFRQDFRMFMSENVANRSEPE